MTDHAPTLPRDLGDGLILRRAILADTDALVELNSTILVDPDGPCPDEGEAAWTRDLMSGAHPTVTPEDYTVVEDRNTGQIVSAMVLISQTWSYDGIPFAVGRPEQVVTRPEYRGRGLVRAQIEALHARSAAKGELVQGITGIPYFYRQFGYEMAVTLDGGREVFATGVPALKGDATEPFRLSAATADDAAWMREWMAQADRTRAALPAAACAMRPVALRDRREGCEATGRGLELSIIETPDGEALGYVGHESRMMSDRLSVMDAEVRPGVSWLRIVAEPASPPVGGGGNAGRARRQADAGHRLRGSGRNIRCIEVAPKALAHVRRPYTWYLRVATCRRS